MVFRTLWDDVSAYARPDYEKVNKVSMVGHLLNMHRTLCRVVSGSNLCKKMKSSYVDTNLSNPTHILEI